MADDFFDNPAGDETDTAATAEQARKRRRTRTIALVALGSAAAFGGLAYMASQAQEEPQQVVDANGKPVVDANGQPVTQHRSSSYFPWIWMMSRGGMFGGGNSAPGAASGFNSGGTATAGRPGTSSGSTPASTSRGGFGAFGRAMSGLS